MLIMTNGHHYWRGAEITESRYDEILDIIRTKPTAPEGQDYRLTDNLEWELYDLPPEVPEEDPAQAEYEALLAAYEEGVNNAD